MPAYRFRWDAFDDDAVRAFAAREGYRGSSVPEARVFLAKEQPRPDDDFVQRNKSEIERYWLPDYAGTLNIVSTLQELGLGRTSGEVASRDAGVEFVRTARNSKRLRGVLVEAMRRFGDADREDEGILDPQLLKRFGVVRPSLQPADGRKPHPHQLDAWKALDTSLDASEASKQFSRILVMPTGAGKTYTAVHWLVTRVLAKGGRILWIAHREELLRQAAQAFYALSSLAHQRESLRIRLVAGDFCSTSMIDVADDVVIASMQSLARNPQRAAALINDPDRFVVVDEAHRSAARTYLDLLQALQKRPAHRLLGLTATPTRTHAAERPLLHKIFGANKPVYQIAIQELINRKVLAEPIPVRIRTHVTVDIAETEEDEKHNREFNQPSDAQLDKVAQTNGRNKLIVKHYVERRAVYGKTLVFAINVRHAALLAGDFRKAGVKADYIASKREDGSTRTDQEILEDFRADDGLEVLVNVNMLTEGVDLPKTQTVFLVRPSNSEILIRQMIGRALRGKAANGTEKAYLVAFIDDWTKLRDWKDPLSFVPDIVLPEVAALPPEPGEPAEIVDVDAVGVALGALSWDAIRTVADELWARGSAFHADAFEAVPNGYFHCRWEVDGEEVERTVPVLAHQQPCYDALVAHAKGLPAAERSMLDVDTVREQFFADCDDPQPSKDELFAVVSHLRDPASDVAYSPLASHDLVDPYAVAKEIHARDLGERAKRALIDERFGLPLARAIYRTQRAYHSAVEDALFEEAHPEDSTRIPKAIPLFEPLPNNNLLPGPHHDLDRLLREMMVRGADIVGVAALPGQPSVEWTKRIVKGVFARAHYENDTQPGAGTIKVNVLLDSPDFSEETLRFLLWHEYLHLYLKVNHPPQFRDLERKWPSAVDGDRELDTLHQRFGVNYW